MSSYDDLSRSWKALRDAEHLTVREVACAGAARTLLCVELGDAAAPAIALSAAVHGNEPAGAYALLELARSRELDARFCYRIWPCLNPSGFDAHTRENAEGADVNRSFGRGGSSPEARAVVTANRDRKFALAIDLHEDCDARGFYAYAYGARAVAAAAVAAVREAGFPLEAEPVLLPDPVAEAEAIGGLSYTLALIRHAAQQAVTLETPDTLAREDRVRIHAIAVKAAIKTLANMAFP